jgi:hypothetical protein
MIFVTVVTSWERAARTAGLPAATGARFARILVAAVAGRPPASAPAVGADACGVASGSAGLVRLDARWREPAVAAVGVSPTIAGATAAAGPGVGLGATGVGAAAATATGATAGATAPATAALGCSLGTGCGVGWRCFGSRPLGSLGLPCLPLPVRLGEVAGAAACSECSEAWPEDASGVAELGCSAAWPWPSASLPPRSEPCDRRPPEDVSGREPDAPPAPAPPLP